MARDTRVKVGSIAGLNDGRGGRSILIPGVDKPDAFNTGPMGTLTDFGSGAPINISAPGTEGPFGDAHYRKRYLGRVTFTQGLTPWALKFRECEFLGPDPDTITDINQANVIQNYGNNPSKVEIWDSLVSPGRWYTAYGRTNPYPAYTGIFGGNLRVRNTEIAGVHDGWGFVGPNGSVPSAATNHEALLQQSWVHGSTFANDWYPPDDGHLHCDAGQTHTGRNITIRGNVLGGPRDMTGYQIWPGGFNTGDDFFNACLMLAQEVDVGASNKIENLLIELNWLYGGCVNINFAYDAPRPNTFASSSVINNKFGRRGADWNETLGPQTIPGSPGMAPAPMGTGAGKYFIKHTQILATTTGNVFEDDGTPVPIVTG